MTEAAHIIPEKPHRSNLIPAPLAPEERLGFVRTIFEVVSLRREERLKRERVERSLEAAERFRIEEKIKTKAPQPDAMPVAGKTQRMKGVAGRFDGVPQGETKDGPRPRLPRRSNPTLIVRIFADFFETSEWCLGGVVVQKYSGDLEPGMSFNAAFRLDQSERWYECRLSVVRKNKEDKFLALSFGSLERGAFVYLEQLMSRLPE
jgi:hypothetical protein